MKNSFFSRFTPQEPKFFPMLKRLSEILTSSSDLLVESMQHDKPEEREDYYKRIKDMELREYLETWIKVCFLISNATPDVKFMEEFFKSYSDLTERLRGLQQPVSPEDDAKILEEERNMNSIKEGIKEEHKNEGTD